MTSPDDESTPSLDPAEQQSLRELGERLRDDDPRLAEDLSGARRTPVGGRPRWRRRCWFGLAVVGVAVVSAGLLVVVGPVPGVTMVVFAVVLAVLTTSPEVRARGWPGDRGPQAPA